MVRDILASQDRFKFEVVRAANLREAEEHLLGLKKESSPFDLVIWDLLLPDGNIERTLVKAGSLMGGVPFVILTGYPEFENDAFVLGACGFLHKNELTPDKLLATVEVALS